jgi:hypothetical protein
MNIWGVGCGAVEWLPVGQDGALCRTLVNTEMNHWKGEIFLTVWATDRYWSATVFRVDKPWQAVSQRYIHITAYCPVALWRVMNQVSGHVSKFKSVAFENDATYQHRFIPTACKA